MNGKQAKKKDEKRVRFDQEDDPRSVMATLASPSQPSGGAGPSRITPSARGGASAAYKAAVGRLARAEREAADQHARAVQEAAQRSAQAKREKESLFTAYQQEFVDQNPIVYLVVEVGRPKTDDDSRARGRWPPLIWGVFTTTHAAVAATVGKAAMSKTRYKCIVPVDSTYVLAHGLLKEMDPDTVVTTTNSIFCPEALFVPHDPKIDAD